MEPGYRDESWPAMASGTDIQEFVLEALETLGAPEELRRLQENFDYDPVHLQWGFDGYYLKGPKALEDPRVWVQKICDWLQANYPHGPLRVAEESYL